MTEVKHTPEPWYVEHPVSGEVEICRKFDAQCRPDRDEGAGFGSYLGVHIAGLPHQGDNPCVPLSRALANARRIVACVNACVGIPTEELEAHGLSRVRSRAVGAALDEALNSGDGTYKP